VSSIPLYGGLVYVVGYAVGLSPTTATTPKRGATTAIGQISNPTATTTMAVCDQHKARTPRQTTLRAHGREAATRLYVIAGSALEGARG
jgi:hypothetical protein